MPSRPSRNALSNVSRRFPVGTDAPAYGAMWNREADGAAYCAERVDESAKAATHVAIAMAPRGTRAGVVRLGINEPFRSVMVVSSCDVVMNLGVARRERLATTFARALYLGDGRRRRIVRV